MSRLFNPTLTERFILECMRAESKDDFERVQKDFYNKRPNIDWPHIVEHGDKLTPSLCLLLIRHCKDFQIPSYVISHMKFVYLSSVERNKKIRQEMKVLARECAESGVNLIFLKGAALITTIYKDDEGRRPMDDMDILIRKEDIPKIETILNRIGYIEDYERASREFKTNLSKEYFTKHHFHLLYYKGGLRLELHWGISHRHNSKNILDTLWESRQPVMLEGININILDAEGTIFSACLNFNKDFTEVLASKWLNSEYARQRAFYYILFFLYELKKILAYHNKNIEWDNLCSLVQSSQNEYTIFTLFILAKKIVNADVPDIIFRRAKHNVWSCLFMLYCRFKTPECVCQLFLTIQRLNFISDKFLSLRRKVGLIKTVSC